MLLQRFWLNCQRRLPRKIEAFRPRSKIPLLSLYLQQQTPSQWTIGIVFIFCFKAPPKFHNKNFNTIPIESRLFPIRAIYTYTYSRPHSIPSYDEGSDEGKKKLHYNLYDRFHFSRLFRIAVPALTVRLWHKRAKIFRPVSYTLNCTRNRDYNFSTPSNINMMMFVNRFLFATIFTRKKTQGPASRRPSQHFIRLWSPSLRFLLSRFTLATDGTLLLIWGVVR